MIWLVNISLGQPGWHCISFRNLILMVVQLKIVGHSVWNQGMRTKFPKVFNGVGEIIYRIYCEVQLKIMGHSLKKYLSRLLVILYFMIHLIVSHLTSSLQKFIILLVIDLLHSYDCDSHMNVSSQSSHGQSYYDCSCSQSSQSTWSHST